MACPLKDVGDENKGEDCEGEVHEPTVVSRINVCPTFGRQPKLSLVAAASASVTHFVLERVHRLSCFP